MTDAAKNLLAQALALAPEDRERLVDELQASLGNHEPDAEWAAEWNAECDRRKADLDAGRTTPKAWESIEAGMSRRSTPR